MGWDYELTVEYDSRIEANKRFQDLVNGMSSHSVLKNLTSLRVYHFPLYLKNKGNLSAAIVDEYLFSQNSVTNLKDINLVEYNGNDYLFEATWEVQRYDRNTTNNDLVATVREVNLYVFGLDFKAYPGGLPTGITFNAGSSKLYSSFVDTEAAQKNLDLLLGELKTIVSAGARKIHGRDKDKSSELKRHSLCHNRELSDFCKSSTKVDVELLMSITNRCNDVSGIPLEDGFIVYANSGTHGNLSNFYSKLYSRL